MWLPHLLQILTQISSSQRGLPWPPDSFSVLLLYSFSLQALSISFKIFHYKFYTYLFIFSLPHENVNSMRAGVGLFTAPFPAPRMMLGTRQSILNEWHEGLVHPVIQFLLVPTRGLSHDPLCSHLVLTCSPSFLSAFGVSPSSSPLPSHPNLLLITVFPLKPSKT